MVAYEITFDQNRTAVLTNIDEAPSKSWKKVSADKMIITVTGRNNWARIGFKKNISYKLSDFLVPNKKIPLEIECEYAEGRSKCVDVLIPHLGLRRYAIRTSIQETLDAIVAADKQYTKLGGGVTTVKEPLHANPELLEKLRLQLGEIKSRQK